MTDRHEEAIEVAAEAIRSTSKAHPRPRSMDGPAQLARAQAHAAVTAYLDHAHPTITTVEELDALPGRLTVMDDDGEVWQRAFRWSGAQWHMTGAPGLFHTGGIPIPATVIHWGDR